MTKKLSTAGLRGAHWDAAKMEGRTQGENVTVTTVTGASCGGILYGRGDENSVVMLQHPREFIPTHYLTPYLLDAGLAVYVQAPQSIGNDLRLEHELSVHEVAAGMAMLAKRGFEKTILLGNSGGASLFAYYNEQALLSPRDRLERSPTGRPTRFDEVAMPVPDGIIFVSPHPGQGLLLLAGIDPSVIDENDPFVTNSQLDPFAPDNGFAAPPQSSTYAPDFVERYRAAQRERVERIDAWARQVVDQRREARRLYGDSADAEHLCRASYMPIRTVWRTDADLRCFDLSLDSSNRSYGSLWGSHPLKSNFGAFGFGRLVTAESWLSTWSGLSSMAALPRTAPAIEQPCLMIVYDGDNSVFPEDAKAIFGAIGGSTKSRIDLQGDHHGRDGNARNGQEAAGAAIIDWLGENGFGD